MAELDGGGPESAGPAHRGTDGSDHGHGGPAGHGHERTGGQWGRVRALLHPHSHDMVGQVDTALESSARGIRATQVSLGLLLATALAQLAIALASGSVALFADLVHNVADALTSVPLWIAFVVGRRALSTSYPYGYRRAEDLAGIFIVLMIAVSLVLVGWESVSRLVDPEPMDHPGWVLLAGVIGVVGNELVAVYRLRVGRRIGSAALVADGYHARTDTVASFAVVVAVAGTWLGYPIVDPIVGLLICVVIAWILKSTVQQVFLRLMDGVEPGVVPEIEAVAASVARVQEVDRVQARWTGHRLRADVSITVDRDLTVAEGHEIGEHVRHELLHHVRHLEDAYVHVNPCSHDGGDPHDATTHHRRQQ